MNAPQFTYRRGAGLRRLAGTAAVLLGIAAGSAFAQVDLLPIDHPISRLLERLYYSGTVNDVPVEHFPITRAAALELLTQAMTEGTVPDMLRDQVEYYYSELAADRREAPRSVVIPTQSDSSIFCSDSPFEQRAFTGLQYFDSATDSYVVLDPILDGEFRYDTEIGDGAAILQGGARLRGTILGHLGFSGKATNGTIVGSEDVVLADPRYGKSFKFGVIRQNRDVDFGGGYVRADFTQVGAEIGREPIRLGAGGEETLLLGADLPSDFDYLRFQMRLGKFSYSHVHAALLSDPITVGVGIGADIPQKFMAAHLVTVGPFAGIRASLGEALIYNGRGFEIGYLNPLNFLKSQEHFLRDRDNSAMYAALSVTPARRLFLEGEFLLDDLVFSNIGEGYWGNKTAWRLGARTTALFGGRVDAAVSYTRLEPYVYSHFDTINAYIHDGAMLAASGMEPNSWLMETRAAFFPLPNLSAEVRIGIGEHGANVVENGEVVRNVGGNVRRTFDSLSSEKVEFLDGTLEELTTVRADLRYEFLKNMYARASFVRRSVVVEGTTSELSNQIWLGVRIGSW